MSNNRTFPIFVEQAQKALMYGLNQPRRIPVIINGYLLYIRIFKPTKKYLSFGLFLAKQNAARKILTVYTDGTIIECLPFVPYDDKVKQEPRFNTISNEQIATIVMNKVCDMLSQISNYIYIADPYHPGTIVTTKEEGIMLIQQVNFPFMYYVQKEVIRIESLEVLQNTNSDHVRKCFEKYHFDIACLQTDLREASSTILCDFLCELLKVNKNDWTGFRIVAFILNECPYYEFQLFKKDPESDTILFTGDEAPNVWTKIKTTAYSRE